MSARIVRRAALGLLLGLALTSVAGAPVWADDGKTVPAAKVFPFLEKFLAIPAHERARLKLGYGLRQNNKPAPGIKVFLVEAGGGRTPLPLNAKGVFERLPTLAQMKAKPQVNFGVPADQKFGISLSLNPALKSATEYEVRDLAATVDEANRVIGQAAGPAALAIPDMTGVSFEKSESGVAVFPDGRTQPLPLVDRAPVFRVNQFKGAIKVRLAKAPAETGFYDKKK